ncbi:MAG: relaxase/mobilization nuclease domain-containing protein [Cyclobacteriaceae bacterium]|nr:relaxase/mobilization nuclease domain-containing protein [Cyclobacteriaceae bacterium]
MIVKILSSARNFAGVQYNERKNDAGNSELLVAANFGALGNNPEVNRMDYIRYMQAVSALNPRVSNRQFHAVISVKGTDYPLDKLKEIGVSFLDKMGYGKNPYLIYHHGDTGNTHIHLVSTRVNKQGQKVDDAFEKIRSQKVMQELLSLDPAYEAKTKIEKALGYSFSTEAQFRLLLEQTGYILREKNEEIEVVRYGCVQGSVERAVVQARIGEYSIDENRREQLKAWLLKYAVGKNMDEGIEVMRKKFGVELVYHQAQGQDKPYGYTLIDHTKKAVYKGSQVLSMHELLRQEKRNIDTMLREVKLNNLSLTEFEKVLKDAGWRMGRNGELRSTSERRQLQPEVVRELYYQERRQLADSFIINDPSCKAVLADWLQVRKDDINPRDINQKELEAHKAVLTYLEQTGKWKEGLKHFHYTLLRHNGQSYLVSATEPALLNAETLMGRALSAPEAHWQKVQHNPELNPEQYTTPTHGHQTIQYFLQILADSQRNTANDQHKRKSLKR